MTEEGVLIPCTDIPTWSRESVCPGSRDAERRGFRKSAVMWLVVNEC